MEEIHGNIKEKRKEIKVDYDMKIKDMIRNVNKVHGAK